MRSALGRRILEEAKASGNPFLAGGEQVAQLYEDAHPSYCYCDSCRKDFRLGVVIRLHDTVLIQVLLDYFHFSRNRRCESYSRTYGPVGL